MKNKGELSIPAAIIVAGLIVGGAVIFTNSSKERVAEAPTEDERPNAADFFVPVSAEDNIRGNKDAKVKLVEYSDIDCPFCANVHTTLKQLVDENNGDVAWVYRHFPLESLHPNAFGAAVATECVADQNPDMFWTYIDALFANGVQSTPEVVLAEAEKLGSLDIERFKTCIAENKFKDLVNGQIGDAGKLGFTGTPAIVIVGPEEGQLIPITGAQKKETFQQAIDTLLK